MINVDMDLIHAELNKYIREGWKCKQFKLTKCTIKRLLKNYQCVELDTMWYDSSFIDICTRKIHDDFFNYFKNYQNIKNHKNINRIKENALYLDRMEKEYQHSKKKLTNLTAIDYFDTKWLVLLR